MDLDAGHICIYTFSMETFQHDIEGSLGYLIGRLSRVISSRLTRRFIDAGYDVTNEQWSVLVHLFRDERMHQYELAEASGRDETTMTRLITGLEKKGLVRRIPDSIDKRRKIITLTSKGKDLQDGLIEQAQKLLEDAHKDISEADAQVCKKVLRRALSNLSG